MFGNMGYPSVADIAAAFPNRGNNDGNGWGGDGGWWILIILLAMWGGFGGNGWGGGNNGTRTGQEFTDAAIQRGFDNQAVITKLDGINSGLCSLGYDQLAQMNGIQQTVMQTGFGLQQAINDNTVANMQNTNALSRQFADCCCENRLATKDLQYTMAQDTCALKTEVHQTGDAIIQNNNWNFRDLNDTIRDGFANIEKQNLIQQNKALENQLNNAQRQAEFSQWANYITSYLAPKTNPAFIACNPSTGMVLPDSAVNQIAWQVAQQLNGGNCGCNTGCCGNNFCG